MPAQFSLVAHRRGIVELFLNILFFLVVRWLRVLWLLGFCWVSNEKNNNANKSPVWLDATTARGTDLPSFTGFWLASKQENWNTTEKHASLYKTTTKSTFLPTFTDFYRVFTDFRTRKGKENLKVVQTWWNEPWGTVLLGFTGIWLTSEQENGNETEK